MMRLEVGAQTQFGQLFASFSLDGSLGGTVLLNPFLSAIYVESPTDLDTDYFQIIS